MELCSQYWLSCAWFYDSKIAGMLTEIQEKKLTHYFNVLDFDSNKLIEKDDFTSIGENLCILWGFKPGSDRYNEYITKCENLWVSFREFINQEIEESASLQEWLEFADKGIVNGSDELYEKHVNQFVKDIFDVFDANGDGFISLDEYIDLFMAYRIEIRYSAKSFTKIDLNKDDLISREELLSAVREFYRSNDKDAPGNWLFGFWDGAMW